MRGVTDGRGERNTNREYLSYGLWGQPALPGLPSFYEGYESRITGITPDPRGRLSDEIGGSAFTALVYARLYGDRPALGQTFRPTIDNTRINFAVNNGNSGIVPLSASGAVGSARYGAVFNNSSFGNATVDASLGARERQRMFYLTRPNQAMAFNFRGDVSDSTGTATDTVLSLAGKFGIADEIELRSFQGLNRTSVTTSLESTVDGRSASIAQTNPAANPGGKGPFRSNRPLSVELGGNYATIPDRNLVSTPFSLANADDLARADWATGLLRNQTSVRNYVTTISASRPLITDPSRPLLSVRADQTTVLPASSNAQTGSTWPAVTLNDAAKNRRDLDLAVSQPLDAADLPTAIEPILAALERMPLRVRSNKIDANINGDYWKIATPYVSTTPVDRIPAANFEQSVAVAQLFRGYLDSLAPDLAGHPHLWEGGRDERPENTYGLRSRTRSLSYGDRSISETRSNFNPTGSDITTLTALPSGDSFFDSRGTDYDLNISEVRVASQLRRPNLPLVPAWKPELSLPWLGNTAELATRASAHLTANFLDQNDVSDRPSAFTIVFDPAMKDVANGGFATGTRVQNYGLFTANPPTVETSRSFGVEAQPNAFIPSAVGYMLPPNASRAFDAWVRAGNVGAVAGRDAELDWAEAPTLTSVDRLLGRLPDYRIRGVLDVDYEIPGDRRTGQVGELPSRMPREYLLGAAPLDALKPNNDFTGPNNTAVIRTNPLQGQSTPPLMNIIGIKPQPFITAAMSLVMYADATNQELTEPVTGNGQGSLPRKLRMPMINGEKAWYNRDFLGEVVAFQLHNPFDRPLSLTLGSPIADRAIDPQTGQVPTAASAADALKRWRKAYGGETISQADNTPLLPAQFPAIQYYLEFAGRYYAAAELVQDKQSDAAQVYSVTMQPGETRFFYALARDPAFFVQRWRDVTNAFGERDASSPTAEEIDLFYHWINRQLAVENTVTERDNGGLLKTKRAFLAPIRLMPVDPTNMTQISTPSNGVRSTHPSREVLTALPENIVRGVETQTAAEVTLAWGQNLSDPQTGESLRKKNASDTEIRLWRNIRDEREPTGNSTLERADALLNDMLVDRLRQPKNSTAVGTGSDTDAFPFFKRTTTVFGQERDFPRLNIGFEPRKPIEGKVRQAGMLPVLPVIGMPTFALASPHSRQLSSSGLGLLATGLSATTASATAAWPVDMASRMNFAAQPSPQPGRDDFDPDEDPLTQQKFENAKGNGYSTVLYAAILRPGMKYDFPRAYKPNIEDSDDVALPRGVLPPWLMEAKAGVLSHNDVFDTFDRLELRTRQNTREAFIPTTQFIGAQDWIRLLFPTEQGAPVDFYFNRPTPTTKKPANAASYKFQLSMFLDRGLEPSSNVSIVPVMEVRSSEQSSPNAFDLTPRKTVVNEYVEGLFTPDLTSTSLTDEKIARVLAYRHYTKPYIGADQFSLMIRFGAGLVQVQTEVPEPLTPRITPAVIVDDHTFTNALRPATPFRPSQWTIEPFPRNVPPEPLVVPAPVMNIGEGEPIDYEMYKYIGAFGRDMLYQPAKRVRNPIDPPELSQYPDFIRFSRNDWPVLPGVPVLPVMFGRPVPFGLTPTPAWQLANNGKFTSINQQGNFSNVAVLPDVSRGVDQTAFANFARDNRSAPNLSGLYFRTIVDQLPASLKIAHKPISASIDAGEPTPPIRLTDLLLAWAVGPYEIPLRWKDRNRDERKRQVGRPFEVVPVTNLDERYTTLSEAIALALDYDAPIDYNPFLYTSDLVGMTNPAAALKPVFDRKDAMFRIGQMVSTAPQDASRTAEFNNPNGRDIRSSNMANLSALTQGPDPRVSVTSADSTITAASRYYPIRGVVLDAGRLSLTTSTPFSDIDGSTRFELVRDGPTAQHGSGIPLALNILNRFRVTNEGGVAEPLIGRVNINTAPKAVLSVLPLLRPDPLLVSPPLPRELQGTTVGTAAGWGNVDSQAVNSDAAIRDVQTLLFFPKVLGTTSLLASRGPSQAQIRERFLTQLTDRPTRTDFDAAEPTNPSGPPAFRDMRIDDVAATILAYRDKVPQFVLPRFASVNDNALTNASVRIDFGDANFAAVDRSQFGGLYDAKGRRLASGILPLREGLGFQSFGELMAARFAEQAPVAMSKVEGSERGFLDPPLFPLPGTAPLLFNSRDYAANFNRRNLTLSSTVQLDRVALRSAGLDRYARQERALRHSGLLTQVVRDEDERDPNPYLPVAPERDLFSRSLQYRNPLSGNLVTPINPALANAPFDLPVPTEIAQLLPPKSAANYESRLAILAALAETTTLRSDTFCVWFTVEGYTRDDVAGLANAFVVELSIPSPGTTAGFDVPAIAKPMSPTLRRRFVMILDRSNVVRPGDKPKVLSLQEVPFDAKSVPE